MSLLLALTSSAPVSVTGTADGSSSAAASLAASIDLSFTATGTASASTTVETVAAVLELTFTADGSSGASAEVESDEVQTHGGGAADAFGYWFPNVRKVAFARSLSEGKSSAVCSMESDVNLSFRAQCRSGARTSVRGSLEIRGSCGGSSGASVRTARIENPTIEEVLLFTE